MVEDLSQETRTSLLRGVRRIWYLCLCPSCREMPLVKLFQFKDVAPAPVPKLKQPVPLVKPDPIPLDKSGSRFGTLKRRHLFFLNGHCQICWKKDDTVDIAFGNPARAVRCLTRDVVALCSDCRKLVKERLGKYSR